MTELQARSPVFACAEMPSRGRSQSSPSLARWWVCAEAGHFSPLNFGEKHVGALRRIGRATECLNRSSGSDEGAWFSASHPVDFSLRRSVAQ